MFLGTAGYAPYGIKKRHLTIYLGVRHGRTQKVRDMLKGEKRGHLVKGCMPKVDGQRRI